MIPETIREIAHETAAVHRGGFYGWGGDDPSLFDCSGFGVEILKTCGILPRRVDYTASGLFVFLEKAGKSLREPSGEGCFAFWGRNDDPGTIYHVEMVWAVVGQLWLSIGASGGGRRTLTREDAIRDNAFIKVRPMYGRRGQMFFADPLI